MLSLWETCNNSYFQKMNHLLTRLDDSTSTAAGGVSYKAEFKPQCVYTISSSTGQSAVPSASPAIPASKHFPFPYSDTFDSYTDQGTVKYFTDQVSSRSRRPARIRRTFGRENNRVDCLPTRWP